MPSRTADQLKTFNIFLTFNPLLKRLFLLHIDNQFIKFLVNCVFNVVRGNVKITTTTTTTTTANTTEESAVANYQNVARKKLSKFRKVISKLCCRKVALIGKTKNFCITRRYTSPYPSTRVCAISSRGNNRAAGRRGE